jgi:hypothetical protein
LVYSQGQCGQFACWTCDGPVDLDYVHVFVDSLDARIDGVKLDDGCTGRIADLQVVQFSGDGVKVAEGAHDLTVTGGEILCLQKQPTVHQDAIQVMGGQNLFFNDLVLDCGRAGEDLIDSNFFVNGQAVSNVVCTGCWLGPGTAHTANLQQSQMSGLRNSTVCKGKFPTLSFTVGPLAVNVVNDNNTIVRC